MKKQQAPMTAGAICFGMGRSSDEQSLHAFLQRFTREEFLNTLIPRLTKDEINSLVAYLSSTMQKHLSEKEYHKLFLSDQE